jgi:hypothetical protein
MIHSFDWPTLQERSLKTRLHIFYKIINNKIAVPYDNILIPTYLLTLPLCTGVSRVRALSPAHTFSSHTISPPPQQKICLLSSVAIFVYNRSAISVNRRDVSYQFLSSFSRLFVQEYETDCCLRNLTDNNTN